MKTVILHLVLLDYRTGHKSELLELTFDFLK